jgi:hypothetical protein
MAWCARARTDGRPAGPAPRASLGRHAMARWVFYPLSLTRPVRDNCSYVRSHRQVGERGRCHSAHVSTPALAQRARRQTSGDRTPCHERSRDASRLCPERPERPAPVTPGLSGGEVRYRAAEWRRHGCRPESMMGSTRHVRRFAQPSSASLAPPTGSPVNREPAAPRPSTGGQGSSRRTVAIVQMEASADRTCTCSFISLGRRCRMCRCG